MRRYYYGATIVLFVSLLICGCSFSKSSKSFSKSSKSISKSASSPSRWSARSGKNEGGGVNTAAESYQDEVAALTVLYVKSGGSANDFQRELSMVSNNHGIVDWENNAQTYEAIGNGLRQSNISNKSINKLPFLKSKSFINHYTQILSGYNIVKNSEKNQIYS